VRLSVGLAMGGVDVAQRGERTKRCLNRRRRRALLIAAAVVAAGLLLRGGLAEVRSEPSPTAEQILERVCERYAGLESLEIEGKASYSCTFVGSYDQHDRNFSMKLQRSGRVCAIWYYRSPRGREGTWTILSTPDGESPVGFSPAAFLSGNAEEPDVPRQMWVENWLALRLFFPEPDAKGWPEADMSWPPPEQVGRHRGVPGKTLQWLVGRVVLWKVKRDLRAELQSRAAADPGYRAVVTTTYETIVANRYLAPAEFALSMPPQGVLDDDFWQRIVARREALEEVARERREAAGASHALTEEPRAEDTGP